MAGLVRNASRKVLTLAVIFVTQALALTTRQQPFIITADHVLEFTHHGSKPGTAKCQDWKGTPMFLGGQEWRAAWGGRLMWTLRAKNAMKRCKRFVSVDNYTWCTHTMPKDPAPSVYTEHEYTVPRDVPVRFATAGSGSLLALSFGVSQPDIWSEVMSNKFSVGVKLFDCGSEPPTDLRGNHSRTNACASQNCYSTGYEVEKACLDDSSGNTAPYAAENGKTYQPLSASLRDRAPLSTFVKLDVDGAEWQTLEWLVGNDGEIKKIRTLDVKVHVTKDVTPATTTASTDAAILHHIEIMERLAQKFAVVGSSLEGALEKQKLELERAPHPAITEPPIHTQGGLAIEEFSVSYVNHALL